MSPLIFNYCARSCYTPVSRPGGVCEAPKKSYRHPSFQFAGVKLMTVQPLWRVPGVEDSILLYRAREKLPEG